MSKKSSQIASENMSMKFSKGWGIILYQALMFFFLIGFSIDGLNIVAPAFAESTGIAYDQVLTEHLREMVGFLAPVLVRPGELELEALAAGALRVLRGEEAPRHDTGQPVFSGFPT